MSNRNQNQNQNQNNHSMIYGQYGTNIVPANEISMARGSGKYNPYPKLEQTTDRGPAYSKAFDVYNYNGGNNGINGTKEPQSYINDNDNYQIYQSDVDNKRSFVVGSSNFHSEPKNSWNRPDFGNTRGPSQYAVWAVSSLNITPNALLNFFFSEENIDYIHGRIIEEVKRIKGLTIQKQSTDELLIIMRNKYMYSLEGYIDRLNGTNQVYNRGEVTDPGKVYYKGGLEQQLTLLNKSVLEETVKSVLSGITEYQRYYKDASSLYVPLSNPVLTSQKGSKSLQENLGFESSANVSKAMSSYNERFNIL